MTGHGYPTDLAYIHHVGFGTFAEQAAPRLLDLLRRSGITRGRVVDLGSGSGIWARHLVDAGYEVVGIDLSADMVALARERVPEATFHEASFLDAELPRCAAVTSIGESLSYRFDPRGGRTGLRRLFQRVHAALQPGGLFVFDVAEPGRAGDLRQRFWQGEDWACLVQYETDEARCLLTRRITTFRELDGAYRRSQETHVQDLHRASELAADLRRRGFRVRITRRYGDLRLWKHQAALIARRP